jgi:hypothetical protein
MHIPPPSLPGERPVRPKRLHRTIPC